MKSGYVIYLTVSIFTWCYTFTLTLLSPICFFTPTVTRTYKKKVYDQSKKVYVLATNYLKLNSILITFMTMLTFCRITDLNMVQTFVLFSLFGVVSVSSTRYFPSVMKLGQCCLLCLQPVIGQVRWHQQPDSSNNNVGVAHTSCSLNDPRRSELLCFLLFYLGRHGTDLYWFTSQF